MYWPEKAARIKEKKKEEVEEGKDGTSKVFKL